MNNKFLFATMVILAALVLFLGGCNKQGPKGRTGVSCTVVEVTEGALISCTDGSSQLVTDGLDGQDGVSIEVIDPCGDDPNEFDEILLKLTDGTVIAYFKENGHLEFLSVLDEGNYVTTDKQACEFSIDSNGNIYY